MCYELCRVANVGQGLDDVLRASVGADSDFHWHTGFGGLSALGKEKGETDNTDKDEEPA